MSLKEQAMGVSVISTSTVAAAAASSAASSTTTSANEGLSGDFAALLFGEIQSLLAPAAAKSEKGTATAGLDDTAKPAALADQEASASLVDPAVMAALLGNTQVTPTTPPPGTMALQPPLDKPSERQLTSVGPALLGKDAKAAAVMPGSDKGKTLVSDTPKSLAPPALTDAAGSGTRSEAANIAVETKLTDAVPAAMASAANTLAAGRQSAEAATVSRQTNIDTPLHTSAWPQQFSEKVVWLAKNDLQSAQININPPQLGPIQITVNLSGDQATLAFASPHAEVRQAIENALPQLKEMLSTAGINLGQSNVGANLSQQNPDNPFQAANGNRSVNENAILPANDIAASMVSSQVVHRGRGLVDLFA
jgi:flagellar hook-length control protein FliK